MKRFGNLFARLVSWENLVRASHAARRHKRLRDDVLRFEYFCEPELLRLQRELTTGEYQPGTYRTFWIREPKLRLISAAPYRDRVVHHALCRIVEPIFERTFTEGSYACRLGRGTHAAVRKAHQLSKRYRFVCKADIEKFFPSIDHEVVCQLFGRKIKDPRVMELLVKIVSSSHDQPEIVRYYPGDTLFSPHERRRGIPIGNQTSQFLANVMLNPLDHYVAESLRVGGYVRYCDDFLIFADDKATLHQAKAKVQTLLEGLRLSLHPHKCVVFPVNDGIPFLGYRIFPTHLRLAKDNVHRFRRRLRSMQRAYRAGRMNGDDVSRRIVSWLGHARHAATYRLAADLLDITAFIRQSPLPAESPPNDFRPSTSDSSH
jgi:retron-type reverse transcriptase